MQVALQPTLGMNPTYTSSLMPLASTPGSDRVTYNGCQKNKCNTTVMFFFSDGLYGIEITGGDFNMKWKRILLGLAIVLLQLMVFADVTQAQQPTDFLIHQHSITIYVACMESALVSMSTLPGFELSSQIWVVAGRGRATRMVQNRDLDRSLNLLNGFGYVTHSQSEATNVFSEWAGLTAEINVRNREYERLMELLYDANTLDEFRQIEVRLQEVIATLERLRGRLNGLEFDMGSSQIVVSLAIAAPVVEQEYEPEPEDEPEEEPGRWRQIADEFMRSLRGTSNVTQVVLIFLARISLPLVIVLVVGVFALRVYKRQNIQHPEGRDENNEEE